MTWLPASRRGFQEVLNIGLDWLSGDPVLQRDPVQKLPRDERLPVLVVNFVNRADVRMIECRGSFGLALKAAECLRVLGYVVGQELESHKTTEFDILGLVHHAHPATAELLDDAVVREGLANHAWQILRG